MKKKIISAFAVSLSLTISAQSGSTGINTTNPTEMFDVNGIERLRSLPESGTINAIYTKSDGTKSFNKDQTFIASKTLVADSNGVIGTLSWLPAQNSLVLMGADGTDAVASTRTASARNGATGTTASLATKVFTLTKRSMVTFSFNLSVSSILTYNGATLTDGTSKRIGAKVLLNSAGIINSGIPFTNNGAQYTSGFYYLNGSRTILLNAGTYTVDLVGNVYAYDNDNIGITATFGSTTDDQLDIIAVPI